MFRLDENLANALIRYLAGKPYIEVREMIDALQHLEKIEDAGLPEKKIV